MGHDYKVGDLHIEHPFARATAASAMAGAGYVSIMNSGTEDDALIGIEADYPRVMMHDSVMTDGVASMAPMDRVVVPAGGTVTFAPGGLHIMFMGLNGDPLEEGEKVPATLIFERAGRVDVVFSVEAGDDAMDHGAMDHTMPVTN